MKKDKLIYINKEQTSGFSCSWGATISFAGSAVSVGRLPETDQDMVNSGDPEGSAPPNRSFPEIIL
jgi:hypothetical protein